MHHRTSLRSLALFTAFLPAFAGAQISPKPDGEFRSIWGLSSSYSAGNTNASTVTITTEGARQTDHSKWLLNGRAFYARTDAAGRVASYNLGTQYDQDLLNNQYFGVTKIDLLRDRPSNINLRASLYGGVGRHMVRNDRNTWDIVAGLGYSEDRYVTAANVSGDLRTRYGRAEGVLSQSSTHKLTPTTTLRQKFEVYPNLTDKGEYRTVLDVGLSVAMTERMQLTTGLLHRYNSDPGLQLKRYDTLFLTGVSLRFD